MGAPAYTGELTTLLTWPIIAFHRRDRLVLPAAHRTTRDYHTEMLKPLC